MTEGEDAAIEDLADPIEGFVFYVAEDTLEDEVTAPTALFVRYEAGPDTEHPIYTYAPRGMWHSLDRDYFLNCEPQEPTDEFLEAVIAAYEWSLDELDEDVWESMPEHERLTVNDMMNHICVGHPTEQAMGLIAHAIVETKA